MPDSVISVRGLTKSYGDVQAVRGIDLEVSNGEIFAFLGPNGAGKTTTVEILEGFRRRDEGEAMVLGEDPSKADRSWRERVGFVLQQSKPDAYLTVREALSLYAGYYTSPRPIEETIELIGLVEAAGASSQNGSVSFHSGDPVRTLHDLTEWALARNVDLEGLEVRRPTLEDIYLELTGGSE